MRPRQRAQAAIATATAIGLVAAGCAGGDGGAQDEQGEPVKGGTLEVVGAGDVDHLDPASAYYTSSYALERTFTRQLLTYPASDDLDKATTVVPDMARTVPTKQNGGVSADGTTYTFRLRDGVSWDTDPSRPVTADDVVRGFERICNPASPGVASYYTDTITGFGKFCAGFAKVDPADPKAMADYIDDTDIAGVRAPDESTVVLELDAPASDFLNIVAMPFASPAPVEYLDYVPDSASFRQNTVSSGPYSISRYRPGREIYLKRNPAWKQSSDPVRHQYVEAIRITQGQSSDTAVQQQLEAGTADLTWDLPVPTADLARLRADDDPRFAVYPSAGTDPYLVLNLLSPNDGGALGKVGVRRALQFAVDKTAIGKIYGGRTLARPLDQVIPPGQGGHQPFNMYPTDDHRGDPATCKRRLAAAGYPDGLDLTFVVRNEGNHPAVGQSIQSDLARCGVNVKIVSVGLNDFYAKYLANPSATKSGTWDIAEPGFVADWWGNNGRSLVASLFDGRTFGPNTSNFGGYDNPKVNRLIDKALVAPTPAMAARYWHQADRTIMSDAAVIPLQTQSFPHFRSERVQNARYSPFADAYDYTNLWLD